MGKSKFGEACDPVETKKRRSHKTDYNEEKYWCIQGEEKHGVSRRIEIYATNLKHPASLLLPYWFTSFAKILQQSNYKEDKTTTNQLTMMGWSSRKEIEKISPTTNQMGEIN